MMAIFLFGKGESVLSFIVFVLFCFMLYQFVIFFILAFIF